MIVPIKEDLKLLQKLHQDSLDAFKRGAYKEEGRLAKKQIAILHSVYTLAPTFIVTFCIAMSYYILCFVIFHLIFDITSNEISHKSFGMYLLCGVIPLAFVVTYICEEFFRISYILQLNKYRDYFKTRVWLPINVYYIVKTSMYISLGASLVFMLKGLL